MFIQYKIKGRNRPGVPFYDDYSEIGIRIEFDASFNLYYKELVIKKYKALGLHCKRRMNQKN